MKGVASVQAEKTHVIECKRVMGRVRQAKCISLFRKTGRVISLVLLFHEICLAKQYFHFTKQQKFSTITRFPHNFKLADVLSSRQNFLHLYTTGQSHLKGPYHEIIFTRFFLSIISFLSYQRYSMRILNFDEFSLCHSSKKETLQCRLHWQVWTPRCSLHW